MYNVYVYAGTTCTMYMCMQAHALELHEYSDHVQFIYKLKPG